MANRRAQIRLQAPVLRWARERAQLEPAQLARKLQVTPEAVEAWERSGEISVARANNLAHHTHTPLGFLYLPAPPEERLPIADFRTRSGDAPDRPSPDLLETVYLMQRRQLWLRDELTDAGAKPLGFVGGSVNAKAGPVAAAMADVLQLRDGWAAAEGTWTDALTRLRDRVEAAGVLLVFNGIVGNNTSRKLNRDEFQGFALVDEYAPLIFVNGTDFKSAQMFTIAHEMAHILLGASGVSRFRNLQLETDHSAEVTCDAAAAEFLVPAGELDAYWPVAGKTEDPYRAIARKFKVSALVSARRALDRGLIGGGDFHEFYEAGRHIDWGLLQSKSSGGDFWNNQRWRVGHRFGSAVYRAVKEGRLTYRDAYRLTGLGGGAFEKMPAELGIEA